MANLWFTINNHIIIYNRPVATKFKLGVLLGGGGRGGGVGRH